MNEYYFEGQFNYIYRQTENPPHNETALHSHRLFEILYFESGEGELVLEDKRIMLFPGALLLIPQNTRHCINILSEKIYGRAVINFEKGGSQNSPLFSKAAVFDISENSRLISLFGRMKDYSELFSGAEKQEIFKALVTELVLLLEKTVCERSESYGRLMSEVMEYIEKNLTEIQDLKELCEALHISRAQLYREFLREVETSPMRYINGRRLEMAQNLLRIGEDATKVCFRCGFRDYSAFYRAYKTKYGYPPGNTKLY